MLSLTWNGPNNITDNDNNKLWCELSTQSLAIPLAEALAERHLHVCMCIPLLHISGAAMAGHIVLEFGVSA